MVVAVVATSATALKMLDPAAEQARARFEKFKALAGEWTGTSGHGDGPKQESTFRYAVTAGGSAVIETLFVGTPKEMVTVFHLDGNKLVLTHYCMLANQPRMTANPDGTATTVSFEYSGGSNIKSKNDPHMHAATYTFDGNDRVRSTWAMYEKGKESQKVTLELRRKKS